MPETKTIPGWLVQPIPEFGDSFLTRLNEGARLLKNLRVDIVGLARDCADALVENLPRAKSLGEKAKSWRVYAVENDSVDGTKDVLREFCLQHASNAACLLSDKGRRIKSNEWAGERTAELAEYRTLCQDWVRDGNSDLTVVIDWDAWGGWIEEGVLVGVAELVEDFSAYGMASVSLLETPAQSYDIKTTALTVGTQWVHYDCWALRLNSYWDDYGRGVGGWKHHWLPPVGSPIVRVCSAFGGLTIYKTRDYLTGRYDGSDCEHVPFHRSIQEATGRHLYLNPSQRTVMRWEPTDGQHNTDSNRPVQG